MTLMLVATESEHGRIVRPLAASDVSWSSTSSCAPASGRIAIDRLAQIAPDCVTLGMEMPDLDGLGTPRELRRTRSGDVVAVAGRSRGSALTGARR